MVGEPCRQGQDSTREQARAAKHEARAGRRYRQQVGADRHRSDDQHRALVDDAERRDHSRDGHENEVLDGGSRALVRLAEDVGPDDDEIGRVRERTDDVEARQDDVVGEDPEISQRRECLVGSVCPDVGRHQRSTTSGAFEDADVSSAGKRIDAVGDRDHRFRCSVNAQLQHVLHDDRRLVRHPGGCLGLRGGQGACGVAAGAGAGAGRLHSRGRLVDLPDRAPARGTRASSTRWSSWTRRGALSAGPRKRGAPKRPPLCTATCGRDLRAGVGQSTVMVPPGRKRCPVISDHAVRACRWLRWPSPS